MFSTLVSVALFASVAVNGVLADFAINSPVLTQCQESTVSWEPTKGPYTLLAVKSTDPCGDALVDIGDFATTLTKWKVNVPSGTKIILSVTDSEDNEAWSNELTVGPSSDASCLTGATSSSSSAASTPSAPSVADNTGSGTTPSAGGVEALGGAANAADPFSQSNGAISSAAAPIAALTGLVAAFILL
ncbi:hypothetical protein CPB83DRAFT_797346 [Crepidotus variabilis]|uniref:Uncharacterized protein n=1 Tax=Crepidotus variabilis TaxID=179855 RepID=A0A9P6E995_9AGAR|nr:hypothetical protein CPB83DRAFT_797346 [Crepidotus variabilis]